MIIETQRYTFGKGIKKFSKSMIVRVITLSVVRVLRFRAGTC